ncbi:hypothetical protein [Agreia sp. COWG]|uniref:hypothetical protein n=1 Tax=Agreia sp. COWG TaxID=2773266 RepID=UPI001927C04D|nr:hypothetical protein [Agreia sp. COWG]CAD5990979.1 conserved exported protein of unknown function [Agreia sp. COWG]
MRKKIAVIVGVIAGAMVIGTSAFIGVGVIDSMKTMAAASEPPAVTLIDATPSTSDASKTEASAASVVSNLPSEMIAGLPEYTNVHDRDTYIRVQTWIKICMRETAGHSYQFDLAPEAGDVVGLVSTGFIPLPAGLDQHEQLSLYGEPDNLLPSYDWQAGGCYGEAIHKQGLLDDGGSTFSEAELAKITEVYNSMASPPEPAWGYAGATPGESVSRELFASIDASITSCMAENGIQYSHTDNLGDDGTASLREGAFAMKPIEGSSSETFFDDASIVLYGARQSADAPYDWTRGGCYGQAVHAAGIAGAQ